jgi:hypothetical protein
MVFSAQNSAVYGTGMPELLEPDEKQACIFDERRT